MLFSRRIEVDTPRFEIHNMDVNSYVAQREEMTTSNFGGNSLVLENPSLCLATGGLHYRIAGLSEGEGVSCLSCGIIFDTAMPDLFNQLVPGLDSGFKLSSVLLLKRSGESFLFYDSDGFVHRLVRLGLTSNYVDENGTGFVYDTGTGIPYVFDRSGRISEAFFNGTSIGITSCSYALRISYSYDGSGRLTEMSCNTRKIVFTYENGKLCKFVLFIDNNAIQCIRIYRDEGGRLTGISRRNPKFQDSDPNYPSIPVVPVYPPIHFPITLAFTPISADLFPSGDDLKIELASFTYGSDGKIVRISEQERTRSYAISYSGNATRLTTFRGNTHMISDFSVTFPESSDSGKIILNDNIVKKSQIIFLDGSGKILSTYHRKGHSLFFWQ